MGALGLFAMIVGLTLLVLETATPGRILALLLALVALFFTHVFRYPIALVAVFGIALLVRGLRGPILVAPALIPACALFAVWLKLRPASFRADMTLAFDVTRLGEFQGWLWGAFEDPAEPEALRIGVGVLIAVAVVAAFVGLRERRSWSWKRFAPSFDARAMVIVLACVLGSLVLFLSLPMAIGDWWYVYPREATAVCFLGLGLLPNLPRGRALRAGLVAATAAASLPMVVVVADNYAAWDPATRDFDAITHDLPQAPKLLYLIFDHTGSTRTVSPFTHLPAYVQAERGGTLSYHMSIYGASPLYYRPREGRESIVPPPTPPRWEATPEAFDVATRGRFFDWFLVRRVERPDEIFEADPAIVLERNAGDWWLYRRRTLEEQLSAVGPRSSTRSQN
jgi:hypothetical protein